MWNNVTQLLFNHDRLFQKANYSVSLIIVSDARMYLIEKIVAHSRKKSLTVNVTSNPRASSITLYLEQKKAKSKIIERSSVCVCNEYLAITGQMSFTWQVNLQNSILVYDSHKIIYAKRTNQKHSLVNHIHLVKTVQVANIPAMIIRKANAQRKPYELIFQLFIPWNNGDTKMW